MEGEFESKTAEQITTDNFSYINRDLVGSKQELVKYEVLPEIIFDTSARSYVYKFSGTKEIRAIELYPENKVHRVRERDIHIYVKTNSEDAWKEVRNWKFNKDEKNGKLSFVFKEAVSAGYVKVRSSWDDRNVENKSIADYSTFKGKPNNLLRIWTLEDTLQEEYSYDGNSNRIRKAENGSGFSYEYYKNTNGGNTAKVRYDGNWYYTYDANGNRTSRAKALISGVADKNKEYWTYEWDLWNRLVKVVQYNAPDNGECVQVSYEYDALNHRIKRTSYDEDNKEREVTKYAYGRNGALAYQEKTVGGSVTKRSFTYLNNEIVGFTDKVGGEETVYYTVTDIQGSITEVYDGSSKLVWKSGYTAFGELAGEVVDLIDFDGMYTGCDYDSATGLTYHWNRWRSEDGSSFISEDPARDGSNWYGYAGQNPMVYVDRIGLFASNGFEGPFTADHYGVTPEMGPQPDPCGTTQSQTQNRTGTDASKRVEVVPEIKTNTTNGNSQEFQNIDLNAKIVKNNVQRLLNGKNAYESSNQDFYMLKIYINLPGKKATNDTIASSKLEQNNEEILTADGGHVFISLINVDFSTMHVQSNTFGLYPAEKTGIIKGKTIKGQIRDDSKSYYDNSFSFIISKTDYENALNFVNKASPKYNLYTNNCVDFAIKVADKANVKLPEFGIGSNPSTLNDVLQLRDLWRKR